MAADGSLRRTGQVAWAFVGTALALALIGYVVHRLRLVVVPAVLALFLAAALHPVSAWLRSRRVPPALASLAAILLLLLALTAVVAGLAPVVAAELPELTDSVVEGVRALDDLVRRAPLGVDLADIGELLERAFQQLFQDGAVQEAAAAAASVVKILAGGLLAFVATFFYLKDGDRFARALSGLVPARRRADARAMGERIWSTLGQYLRGQLIVAVFDALLIGLGLLLLAVPLALPLAVLVLFGGLFPIVGAAVSGAFSVLVALAHGGLWLGLIVLALVVGVQQLEGNVLQPYVLGRVVDLHPFVVVASVAAGAVTLGVLGAFLAVPVAASAARCVEYLRTADTSGPPAG